MRNILVHADEDPGLIARIESGLEIGRRNRSHLSVLVATPYRHFVAMDPFGGAYLLRDRVDEALRSEEQLVARLRGELEHEDIPWDIEVADGDALAAMSLGAALADLAIVSLGNADRRASASAAVAGDLAMTIRAPVLAIPERTGRLDLDAPMMIGWNGSPQAANALRSAIPLIRDASEVRLVTVGKTSGAIPPEDAMRYLSRHAIKAELSQVDPGLDTAEEVLARKAAEMGAGLIVMGAFGRPRLRETFFGGVTRFLLEFAPAPLLLAH